MKKRIIGAILALSLMVPMLSAGAMGETWSTHTHRCTDINPYAYVTHSDSYSGTPRRHQIIETEDYWDGLRWKCDAFMKFQRYYNAKGWITVGSREVNGLN